MIPANARVLPPPPLGERAARLRHAPLFSHLRASELRALAEGCDTVEVTAGQVIVRQGDPAESLYLVVDGLLQASREDAQGNIDLLGHLYKGEYFGEVALLEASVRSATVTARSDAVLMRLPSAAFRQVIAADATMKERVAAQIAHRRGQYTDRVRPDEATVTRHLKEALGELDPDVTEAVLAELEWRWVEEGVVPIRQGDPGDCMYVVLSGRLQVFCTRPDGSEFVVDDLRVGESFGERALLTGEPRSANVRALEDTDALVLGRAGLDALLARHPDLAGRMRDRMAARDANRTDKSALARQQPGIRPAPSELQAILDTPDLALRNLRITWMYHRLSLALRRFLGERDANWACFGCRASFTAGYSIRMEDDLTSPWVRRLARAGGVGRLVRGVQATVGATPIGQQVEAALRTVSACISAGNLRIFAEIGTVMARFLITFEDDTTYDRAKLDGFLATLPPGPPEMGGQDVLREGMRAWYEARFADTPKRRSEWILLGNCYIGVHEQTRVQSDLVEALDAPLRMRLGDEVGTFLARTPLRWLPGGGWMRSGIDAVESALVRAVGLTLRNVVTRRMMRIRLPRGDAWLGTPVPWFGEADPYPPDLTRLELPELRALLDPFGVAGDTPPTGGASDWGVFADRMRFIIALFRARQHDPDLFLAPFDAAP